MNTTSTTNWIAAIGVVIQAMLLISTVYDLLIRRRAMNAPVEIKPQAFEISSKIWFVKNAWGALLGLPFSVWLMFWQVSQPGPPTREFVWIMVFLGLYFALNFFAAVAFAFAAALRPMSQRFDALCAKHDSKPD